MGEGMIVLTPEQLQAVASRNFINISPYLIKVTQLSWSLFRTKNQ